MVLEPGRFPSQAGFAALFGLQEQQPGGGRGGALHGAQPLGLQPAAAQGGHDIRQPLRPVAEAEPAAEAQQPGRGGTQSRMTPIPARWHSSMRCIRPSGSPKRDVAAKKPVV